MNNPQEYFALVTEGLKAIPSEDIIKLAGLIEGAQKRGMIIFTFGNGGSASTASHFAGDMVKGLTTPHRRIRAICLNDNLPAMMAIANDISYQDIFVEQLKNHARPGDLVIGISGSGNSMNVVKALEYANSIGTETVALCGFDGGKIKRIAKHSVHAAVNNMEAVEDIHLAVAHCVKTMLMNQA